MVNKKSVVLFSISILVLLVSVGVVSAGVIVPVNVSVSSSLIVFSDDLGRAFALGSNERGVLGVGKFSSELEFSESPLPVHGVNDVGFLSGVVGVGVESLHAFAVKSDGSVASWGNNLRGQLGIGTTIGPETCQGDGCSPSPVQVHGVNNVGFLTGVVKVAVSDFHVLALRSDGTVVAWGSNGGRLGDGTTIQRNAPVQVKGVGGVGFLTDVVDIFTGTVHGLAVKSDGTAACTWRGNSSKRIKCHTYCDILIKRQWAWTKILNCSKGKTINRP